MIQVYSYISHSAGPENLAISPGYNAAIFNNNLPYSQLVQQVHIPSWYANHYFAFRIPSDLVTQSYRAGFSVQAQTLSSELNVVQNNNSSKLQSDSAWNQLHWTRQKLYAEAGYDLTGSLMKAKLTLPVTLQQISYAGRLYPEDKNLTRLYFNPQLNMKDQVSAENYVSLQYSYRNQIGSIEDIYPGYILTNYRTLYANNASLTEQQVQQVGGGFSYRKAIHLFFWSVNALYSHTAANNISASVITNNIQRGVVLPYPNSMDTWSCSGFISKYVFPLRTTFSGSLQWMSSHSVQIQNSVLLPFNTVSEAVNINADTKISNWVNCSYKASLSRIYSQSPVDVSAHRINQFLQQLSVEYNPVDALQCNVSGEHYFTRQQGNPDLQYFFADASMKFRARRWKTDFELSAVNLLNTKTYQALYLSANTFTASSYTLPGRIILLKVLFNI
jgi:hypothetical protein